MAERARIRRESLDEVPASTRRYISPALYGLYAEVEPLVSKLARRSVLDVGCGTMPFRDLVEDENVVYHGLDIEDRGVGLTYKSDAEAMEDVADSTYDFVLAVELIEHVPHPDAVFAEIARVLKPGGSAVITAPHLSRIHEAPRDFHRFTEFGLQRHAADAGLEVVQCRATGGIFAFLGHQALLAVVLFASRFRPALGALTSVNRYVLIPLIRGLDRLLRTEKLFPLGHVLVASKPSL